LYIVILLLVVASRSSDADGPTGAGVASIEMRPIDRVGQCSFLAAAARRIASKKRCSPPETAHKINYSAKVAAILQLTSF
jgi:hypothetical protein